MPGDGSLSAVIQGRIAERIDGDGVGGVMDYWDDEWSPRDACSLVVLVTAGYGINSARFHFWRHHCHGSDAIIGDIAVSTPIPGQPGSHVKFHGNHIHCPRSRRRNEVNNQIIRLLIIFVTKVFLIKPWFIISYTNIYPIFNVVRDKYDVWHFDIT